MEKTGQGKTCRRVDDKEKSEVRKDMSDSKRDGHNTSLPRHKPVTANIIAATDVFDLIMCFLILKGYLENHPFTISIE